MNKVFKDIERLMEFEVFRLEFINKIFVNSWRNKN